MAARKTPLLGGDDITWHWMVGRNEGVVQLVLKVASSPFDIHVLHGSMLIHGGVAIHIPRALTTSLFRTQSSVYMTTGQINFILCLVY